MKFEIGKLYKNIAEDAKVYDLYIIHVTSIDNQKDFPVRTIDRFNGVSEANGWHLETEDIELIGAAADFPEYLL